ncbi:MAG: DUF134 domain-containing protein [Dissulfurimicrobium sp.]|uniref:DUF134 domain-containing protein n=1 Tax=Dissulfurimicrobium TaxID=1769732 RepID=UPI001EDB8255|nr:DUF134 domain-containing protein [Dissulfurimicrobium hydrothermale]UKL13745.1 DUF134 domain-containing protein [Dissulfurimicrobium hydrothermale]
MPRPPKCRIVNQEPLVVYFKPRGIPMRNLKEVVLSVEGLEAIRLSDVEGLDQEEAALKMGVSRQTFGRILAAARKTVADAIVLGMCLRIEGGNYQLLKRQAGDESVDCNDCNMKDSIT